MTHHELTLTTPAVTDRMLRRGGVRRLPTARPRTPRASRSHAPTGRTSLRTRAQRFAGAWIVGPDDSPTRRFADEFHFSR